MLLPVSRMYACGMARRTKSDGTVVVAIFAAAVLIVSLGVLVAPEAIRHVKEKPVRDAIAEYKIVAKTGDKPLMMKHAGKVAQACLAAHDEAGYRKWKKYADGLGAEIGTEAAERVQQAMKRVRNAMQVPSD